MPNAAQSTTASATTLAAPAPLERPMRKGRVVRVPERWTGPQSGAPFEAVLADAGRICLGVGLVCPKGRLRPGALWIVCEDGTDLMNRAQALDAALALATPQAQTPTASSTATIAGVPAMALLEALVWMEAGAGRDSAKDSAYGSILVSGARSLFADRARALKSALRACLPQHIAAMAEPSPSAQMH